MAGAPRYKLYHGPQYIGCFKDADHAELFCEAMQTQNRIYKGPLTIRDGHSKADIELTYSQAGPVGPSSKDGRFFTAKLDKAVVVDEPDHTAVEITAEADTSKLALDDGGTLQWANITLNQGEIEGVDVNGQQYGVSIHDIGEEPSDVVDYVPEAQSCIEITGTDGRWIVKSLTGTVREWQGSDKGNLPDITRFDLTEYREWRGMRPAELPALGAIDGLLVGYWHTVGHQSVYDAPSAQARDDYIEQCRLNLMGPMPAPEPKP